MALDELISIQNRAKREASRLCHLALKGHAYKTQIKLRVVTFLESPQKVLLGDVKTLVNSINLPK